MMWNDTGIPLAYLITFRAYGTWLHGDHRGSIDRFYNRYKSPYRYPDERWHRHNTNALSGEPVVLDAAQRKSVEHAIHTTCEHRRWHLHAVNVRTNHAYAVVCIGSSKPDQALTAFKANATRQMREDGCWKDDSTPWAAKGSKRRFGTSVVSPGRLSMYGMGRAMNSLTLTINVKGSLARSLPLPVLTPSLSYRDPAEHIL